MAFILDMDGTLIDTEPVYSASITAALLSLGYSNAADISQAMTGLSIENCHPLLKSSYGDSFPFQEFQREFVRFRDEALRNGISLKSGAIELLEALRADSRPTALATSSSRLSVERYLMLTGIRSFFSAIVTIDDVCRGKPHPDIYVAAARQIKAPTHQCIAIEDSEPGIAAAYNAGMIPIIISDLSLLNPETREKCMAILPDLHAALSMLRMKNWLSAAVI